MHSIYVIKEGRMAYKAIPIIPKKKRYKFANCILDGYNVQCVYIQYRQRERVEKGVNMVAYFYFSIDILLGVFFIWFAHPQFALCNIR